MIDQATLDALPTDPGVYLFRDAKATVVYVGKAQNLRNRVRQYFRASGDERFFVAAGYLADTATSVETIVVSADKEALLLENHLIKAHQPRFNVKLRDDKQYLVLRLTKPHGTRKATLFPRVQVVRNIADDEAHYFGPYHSATSARATLRVLNRHFQLRTCTDHVLEARTRPCLQYQIKRCPGPCAVEVAPASYAEQVDDVTMFLGGRDSELLSRLRRRMEGFAAREEFEAAAAIRDSMAAVDRTLAKQDIVQDEFIDQDVWGLTRQADRVDLVVLYIRGGKLVGRRAFTQREQELPDHLVMGEHIQQYYATGTFIPDEVVVGQPLEGLGALADWLSSLKHRTVKVAVPQRGQRVRLLELANRNAQTHAASAQARDDDAAALLQKLQARLSLRKPPRRIECYDIAHLQGNQTVASMVTFVDGVPQRSLYRTFNIQTVENNDFAAMYEVILRRAKRAVAAAEPAALPAPGTEGRARRASKSGWLAPDLIVIDGGKGQLASAATALGDAGLTDVELISLAKERTLESGEAPDRVYLRNVKDAIPLRANSPELYLLARLRDEAHRFANTAHGNRRDAAQLRSSLDDIAGIGPTRRKRLLTHFGSVRAVAQATLDELAAAPGMTRALATSIFAHFHSGQTAPTPPTPPDDAVTEDHET